MDLETLTPQESGKALHLTPAQLYNLRSQGRGPPFVKVGALVRYPKAGVQGWLESGGDQGVGHRKVREVAA